MPIDPAKIRSLLDAKGWSQAELARRADMAPPNLARILSGERTDPNLSTAEKLAKALGCALSRVVSE